MVNRYGPVVAFAERVRKLGPPQQPPLPDVLPIDSIRSLPRDIPSLAKAAASIFSGTARTCNLYRSNEMVRPAHRARSRGRGTNSIRSSYFHGLRRIASGKPLRAHTSEPTGRRTTAMIGDATYLMELSGCKQRASVARWCKKNGIKYFRNALGWPVTTPAALDRALIHGIESGPDWSACDNKKVDSAKGSPEGRAMVLRRSRQVNIRPKPNRRGDTRTLSPSGDPSRINRLMLSPVSSQPMPKTGCWNSNLRRKSSTPISCLAF